MVHPESASSIYCPALSPTQPLTLCPRAGGSGYSQPFASEGYRAPGSSQAFNWSRERLKQGGGGTGRRSWALFRALSFSWRSVLRPVGAGLHQQQPAAAG